MDRMQPVLNATAFSARCAGHVTPFSAKFNFNTAVATGTCVARGIGVDRIFARGMHSMNCWRLFFTFLVVIFHNVWSKFNAAPSSAKYKKWLLPSEGVHWRPLGALTTYYPHKFSRKRVCWVHSRRSLPLCVAQPARRVLASDWQTASLQLAYFNITSKGWNVLTLGQIIEKSNGARTETFPCIVLSFKSIALVTSEEKRAIMSVKQEERMKKEQPGIRNNNSLQHRHSNNNTGQRWPYRWRQLPSYASSQSPLHCSIPCNTSQFSIDWTFPVSAARRQLPSFTSTSFAASVVQQLAAKLYVCMHTCVYTALHKTCRVYNSTATLTNINSFSNFDAVLIVNKCCTEPQ